MAQTQQLRLAPDYDDSHDRRARLTALIAMRLGSNWQVESITNGVATVVNGDPSSRPLAQEVALNPGVTVRQGEQIAAWLAQQGLDLIELRQGTQLTAIAGVLTPSTRALRKRYAQVLRCHPWELEIAVSWALDEGAEAGRIDRVVISRSPSTGMDGETRAKRWRGLVEVTPGGSAAWAITEAADGAVTLKHRTPRQLPARVELDTLLPSHPQPESWARIPIGIRPDGRPAELDLELGPHALYVGPTGSGKSVGLLAHIAGALMRGHSLAVLDPTKAGLDFLAVKPFAWMWADDLASAEAGITAVYAEVARRKAVLQSLQAVKWIAVTPELRAQHGLTPLTVVIDEAGSLVLQDQSAKALPKDHPMAAAVAAENASRAVIFSTTARIAREARFAGIHLVIALQRPDASFLSGEMRSNLTSAVQLASPGKPLAREALGMVFPGEAAHEAAEAFAALDDGQSRGLAVAFTDGGGLDALRIAYADPAGLTQTLMERGLRPLAQTWQPPTPPPATPPGEAGFGWTPGQPPPEIDWGS